MKEIWKPVIYKGIDYTGHYEVSNMGNMVSLKFGKRKEICKCNGYRRKVAIWHNKKPVRVNLARLIASTFIREIKKGEVADHINNNHLDDRLGNIQIISISENIHKDSTNRCGLPVGVYLSKERSSYRYYSTLMIRGNSEYIGFSLNLGFYNEVYFAKQARCIAKEIAKKHNGQDLDSLRIKMQEAVNNYRISVGYKEKRKYTLSSLKK